MHSKLTFPLFFVAALVCCLNLDTAESAVLTVKTLTGKNLQLDVDLSGTEESIKNKILEQEGIPVHQQKIIYNGKVLEEGRALSDYGVQNESILHLVLKLH